MCVHLVCLAHISSSSSCHFCSSLHFSFSKVLQKAVPTKDVTNPVTLFNCLFYDSLLLGSMNNSPLLTLSVQLIFPSSSLIFQNFSSTYYLLSEMSEFQQHKSATLKTYRFIRFFFKFKRNLLAKSTFFLASDKIILQ
jgi:hypothetical protein